MPLSDIVNVTIETSSTSPTQAGFGVPLVLSSLDRPNDGKLVHFYTDLDGMASDNFAVTDPAYLAASAIFSQNPRIPMLAVGTLTTAGQTEIITVTPTAANTTAYTLLFAGTDSSSITSDSSATAAEIVTALKAQITSDGWDTKYHFAMSGTSTLILTFATGHWSKVQSTAAGVMAVDYTGQSSGNDAMENDLTAIKNENDTWYVVVPSSPFKTSLAGVAHWVEGHAKLTCFELNDLTWATSALITYARTFWLYADASKMDDMRNAAWVGKVLPFEPGAATWKFKTLAGITPSPLTPTQIANIRTAGGNFYYKVAGINITSDGKVAAGEFIDVVHGRDWFMSRLQERIYGRLANAKKLPYTDAGLAVIEAEVRGQIRDAIRVGFLSDNPAPTVTVPALADVSTSDKATRTLNNVKFTATLAGAIHVVSISGVISV